MSPSDPQPPGQVVVAVPEHARGVDLPGPLRDRGRVVAARGGWRPGCKGQHHQDQSRAVRESSGSCRDPPGMQTRAPGRVSILGESCSPHNCHPAKSPERFTIGLRTGPGVDEACRERRSPDRPLAPGMPIRRSAFPGVQSDREPLWRPACHARRLAAVARRKAISTTLRSRDHSHGTQDDVRANPPDLVPRPGRRRGRRPARGAELPPDDAVRADRSGPDRRLLGGSGRRPRGEPLLLAPEDRHQGDARRQSVDLGRDGLAQRAQGAGRRHPSDLRRQPPRRAPPRRRGQGAGSPPRRHPTASRSAGPTT